MSGNTRLVAFNPIPKGLYSEKRFRKMTPIARLALYAAHQYVDDREEDGILDRDDVPVLLAAIRLVTESDHVVVEWVNAGYAEVTDSGDLFLVGFRGLGTEARDERRAQVRERVARHRARHAASNSGNGVTDPVTHTVTGAVSNARRVEKSREERERGELQ